MVVGLLTIFGVYGLSVLLMHLVYWGCRHKMAEPFQYVLVTKDNQLQIEWYLRWLLFFSKLKGRDVRIVVFDQGSSDDTLSIVQRLARIHTRGIQIILVESERKDAEKLLHLAGREKCAVLRLSGKEEMVQIPLFR